MVSNQRNSTDLDKEVSFLQVSILQLIRFVGVVQRTDQLVHLQQVILTWAGKHRQNIKDLTPHICSIYRHVLSMYRPRCGSMAASRLCPKVDVV